MMAAYHDDEWGRPERTERGLFEKICLEGFQAGLSWRTVLTRREALRAAFDDFDPEVCAGYDGDRLELAILAPGMLRNAAKIRSVSTNAQATVRLRADGGLVGLIWSFRPEHAEAPTTKTEIATSTPEAAAMAKALRQRGFTYIGPVTAYALMQAEGLVNDHLRGCGVREEVQAQRLTRAAVPVSDGIPTDGASTPQGIA